MPDDHADHGAVDDFIASITPDDSPMTRDDWHASERNQRLSTPDVTTGDLAPDFDLSVYDFSDGHKVESAERFHLQSVAANTPVALVFGSYT